MVVAVALLYDFNDTFINFVVTLLDFLFVFFIGYNQTSVYRGFKSIRAVLLALGSPVATGVVFHFQTPNEL